MGDGVELQYFREDGAEMDKSIVLDPNNSSDDLWSDQIAFDTAGSYAAEATATSRTRAPTRSPATGSSPARTSSST